MLLTKTAATMTVAEFAQELVRLRHKALHIESKGGRAANGRYGDNMKRGKQIAPFKYVKWSRMG